MLFVEPHAETLRIKDIKGEGAVANKRPDKQLLPTGTYNGGSWKTHTWNSYLFMYGYRNKYQNEWQRIYFEFLEKVIVEK